jgi:hypothetical protein
LLYERRIVATGRGDNQSESALRRHVRTAVRLGFAYEVDAILVSG